VLKIIVWSKKTICLSRCVFKHKLYAITNSPNLPIEIISDAQSGT